MATLFLIISFVLLIMETLVGIVANGFIVLINCIDWFRSKKLSPTDLILICLGLSRLMWQALVMLHHTRHLQHNGIGVRDLNTNVHLSAIKALASFAALYLSCWLAISLQTILYWRRNNGSWTSVFFHNISAAYPSGHAVILILINPKLKQAWVRMIHRIKCHVSEPPS
ncbi:taste receptor type 2 member 104-like [Heteronotia binoei]|uniref:taste receptor type 2 member 104-like n=1 Tax=Heteronotia binoei TaxID=13085 RepID=UPI00292F514F|nr:taste receptor type 2 member 104-like [Heteronotia binoei]